MIHCNIFQAERSEGAPSHKGSSVFQEQTNQKFMLFMMDNNLKAKQNCFSSVLFNAYKESIKELLRLTFNIWHALVAEITAPLWRTKQFRKKTIFLFHKIIFCCQSSTEKTTLKNYFLQFGMILNKYKN